MKKPTSFTQYCDDVRQEADGRQSLMGIYPANAIVDLDHKGRLPQVCAYTVIFLPLAEELSSIAVTTSWNDKELQRIDIPEEVVTEFNGKREANSNGKQQTLLSTVMQMRDLSLGDGGRLQTTVLVNGNIIETRSLRLKPR